MIEFFRFSVVCSSSLQICFTTDDDSFLEFKVIVLALKNIYKVCSPSVTLKLSNLWSNVAFCRDTSPWRTPPIIRASAESLTKLKDVRLIQTSIKKKKSVTLKLSNLWSNVALCWDTSPWRTPPIIRASVKSLTKLKDVWLIQTSVVIADAISESSETFFRSGSTISLISRLSLWQTRCGTFQNETQLKNTLSVFGCICFFGWICDWFQCCSSIETVDNANKCYSSRVIVFLRNSSVSLLFCSWLPRFRSGYETAFYLFLCRHNERVRTGEEKTWSRALLVAVKSLFNPTPKFPAAHEFKNLY